MLLKKKKLSNLNYSAINNLKIKMEIVGLFDE